MAITHKYSLVCDEVRREDNGKLIVLGLYAGGNIVVPQIPIHLPSLSFLMMLETDRPGSWNLRCRLQHLETGRTVAEGQGNTAFQQPGQGPIVIRFSPVQFQALGLYSFSATIEEHKDPIITEFNILLPSQIQQMPRR